MTKRLPRVTSAQDYLELEQKSDFRNEYLGGYVYAMAGGSSRHNRISLTIAAQFLTSPKGRRIYQEGMKLHLGRERTSDSEKFFYYPDVMVACGQQVGEYYETDPCILVEVLSPSTADIDMREKRTQYMRIPSMQTYLVVDPESYFVYHFYRDDQDNWQQREVTRSGDIPLPCLGQSITLEQIYRNIT
jgi:Uma2 family endonuclease